MGKGVQTGGGSMPGLRWEELGELKEQKEGKVDGRGASKGAEARGVETKITPGRKDEK